MNTIEKEFLDAFSANTNEDWVGLDEVRRDIFCEEDCAKSCISIVEKYAIGFSDWQCTLVFTENDVWLKEKTTKELYDLYLETLR